MASITIRKLDDTVKAYLRLRSASNGRSVEEEVRVILGELIQGRPAQPGSRTPPQLAAAPMPPPRAVGATGEAYVTLIIGGCIAAHKSPDLILLLHERQLH